MDLGEPAGLFRQSELLDKAPTILTHRDSIIANMHGEIE
jgi:hypothetical protein